MKKIKKFQVSLGRESMINRLAGLPIDLLNLFGIIKRAFRKEGL